jgi:hypothetical protein
MPVLEIEPTGNEAETVTNSFHPQELLERFITFVEHHGFSIPDNIEELGLSFMDELGFEIGQQFRVCEKPRKPKRSVLAERIETMHPACGGLRTRIVTELADVYERDERTIWRWLNEYGL